MIPNECLCIFFVHKGCHTLAAHVLLRLLDTIAVNKFVIASVTALKN